jgi:hypothetical protein
MAEFNNKEIDIRDPGDHDISRVLRDIICDWCDRNFYAETSDDMFCDIDNACKHTICYVCNKEIKTEDQNESDNVAIANNAKAIAHIQCARSVGFRNHYSDTDYNGMIDRLKCAKHIRRLDTPASCDEQSSLTMPSVTKRAR